MARNAFASRVYDRWSAGLKKAGYALPGSVAVDMREVGDGGAEYLGRYLTKATYDAATKTGIEVAAGQVSKVGRVDRNRTPFELLADLATSVDARGFGVRTPRHWAVKEAGDGDWAVIDHDTGEVLAVTPPGEWAIWHEWEQGSKGRRQIMWSRRRRVPVSVREQLWNCLLDVRGETADATDEEVAAADIDGEVVGEVSRADWYRVVVWRPELMTRLLETAEAQGRQGVAMLLSEIGVPVALGHPPPVCIVDMRHMV
ncbi:hypothetical protein [Mycolicibacterium sarraceniae]|uniref:hypothetical protein n=1 Tax=Mycolicibacterium sarraceniae TaxID=1534348 RepID=UPI0013D2A765|nr:hypothetical protein [Mycolicibacterium sarraceniae]